MGTILIFLVCVMPSLRDLWDARPKTARLTGSDLGPTQGKCVSVNWRGCERAARCARQLSPPTPLRKWTFYTCLTSSIATSPLSVRRQQTEFWMKWKHCAVVPLCCQPTRRELIVFSCMVVSVFFSWPLLAEISAGTFLNFASSGWREMELICCHLPVLDHWGAYYIYNK